MAVVIQAFSVVAFVAIVAVVSACDSGAPPAEPSVMRAGPETPITAPEVITHAPRDAGVSTLSTKATPGAPDGKVLALKDLQQSLGSNADSCEGTARILAWQGTVSADKRAWRERTVTALCRDDRWPQRVRECAATADSDPLACTAFLATDRQRSRWNGAFERWLDE